MIKTVISKHDIELAHRQKQSTFMLPENCIVTAAAHDAAIEHGINLVACSKKNVDAAESSSHPKNLENNHKRLIEQIKQKVIEQLPKNFYSAEGLEKTIQGVLAEVSKQHQSAAIPEQSKSSKKDFLSGYGVFAGKKYASSGAVEPNGKKAFSGGFLIDSPAVKAIQKPLPKDFLMCLNTGSDPEANFPMHVDFCSWGAGSFSYACKEALIIVVISGNIQCVVQDNTFLAQAGGVLCLEKDAKAHFITDSAVQCVLIRHQDCV